ncbi:ankyrin repeat-containing domain protein [Sordaria brevicollis]|uniref:Ankyrin repeat-containing domain protein n=1 Tax=Sordaria brevicollis TaxID=83679 RepID=A0AAE0U5I3_SORBR|nr:ankyrin repeat-containing domain protein [Sordaria brevicollis]
MDPTSFLDAYRHYSKYGDIVSVENMLRFWRNAIELNVDFDIMPIDVPGVLSEVFSQAVRRGHEAAVRVMLDAGVDATRPEAGDPGYSPLLAATEEGYTDMARLLWNAVGPQGRFYQPSRRQPSNAMPSCLVVAAFNGHADLVAEFLDLFEGWSSLEKDQALVQAAANWHDKVVLVLQTWFLFESDVIQCALERAINIGGRDHCNGIAVQRRDNRIPLSQDNQIRLVRRLLDAGADPNRTSSTMRGFPIHESYTRIEILKLLLERGADPHAQDDRGETVLHRAAVCFNKKLPGRHFREPVNKEEHLEVLQTLLQHGASPDTPDNKGVTPLHLLADTGTPNTLRLCLKHCADPSSALRLLNQFGESLLHYAAAAGNRDTVEYLLDQGLDVNQATANKWTPLLCVLTPADDHYKGQTAARIAVARLLLDRGASARVITDEGWTPLHALATLRDFDNPEEERVGVAAFAKELIGKGTPVDEEASPLRYCSTMFFSSNLYGAWGHRMTEAVSRLAGRFGEGRVQAYDDYELTPLHWACRTGAMDIFDVLMRHFARKEQTQPVADEGEVNR